MPDRYGATVEQWRYWSSTLGLTADLLPVVSRPDAPISDGSKIRKVGKTPSRYNAQRYVSGIPKWTEYQATKPEITAWSKESDYGICVQTRRLRAIDVDVENSAKAVLVGQMLVQHFGDTSIRKRRGSGKFLAPFWMEEPLRKHVVPVDGGMVEILGDGQQFIAEGWHEAGEPYLWTGYEFPTLDELDFAMLLADLKTIATGSVRIAHERNRLNAADLQLDDDVADWLLANWETYDVGPGGQIDVKCPFSEEHSTETGPSSTSYFPCGTGGHERGNFVCLHAHCTGRSQAEFLNAVGYIAGGFTTLENNAEAPETSLRPMVADEVRTDRQQLIEAERWPRLTRDSASRIEPTMNNLLLALSSPAMIGHHLGYDSFKDVIVLAPADDPLEQARWMPFGDNDYAYTRQELEIRGFKPMGMDMLRAAVRAAAARNQFDAAREWLMRLAWDGEERVTDFAHLGWGWADTPYARAVGRYTWSALAGRVLQPGVQADMAPVLVGPQGIGKTSSIKAMAPHPDFYASIPLDGHDADTSRLLRGTIIAELEELRGLNSRAIEEIKAWISKTHEKWVPKYMEFASTYGRRNLFFGTNNETEFLADPTGERRWLPGWSDRTSPAWIEANREQLWAEGLAIFLLDGVEWEEAEALAKIEHGQFKVADAWEPYVAHWLEQGVLDVGGGKPADQEWLTTGDILSGAIHLPPGQIDRGKETRIGKVMKALGWHRRRMPRGEGDRLWAYTRSE